MRTSPRARSRVVARRAVAGMLVTVSLAACGSGYQMPPVASPVPGGAQIPATPVPQKASPSTCDPRKSLAANSTPPASIIEQGKIRAGVDQTMTRMAYRDPKTGEFMGFDIELLKEIAREMFPGQDLNKVLVFIPITSGEREERLNDGTVDIVADSMTATCERAEEVAFSTDYLDSGQAVMVRGKDAHYQGIEDLAGQRVCAAIGTTSIENLWKRPEKLIPVAVPNWTDCLVMLQQGQVEAISTDHNVLLGLKDLDDSTRILTKAPSRKPDDRSCVGYAKSAPDCPWFSDEPHAIAFRKNDTDFIKFVNYVLQKIRDNGRWQTLHDEWLNGHPDGGKPTAQYGQNATWPPGQ